MGLNDPEKKNESPSERVQEEVNEGLQLINSNDYATQVDTSRTQAVIDEISENQEDLTNTAEYKNAMSKLGRYNEQTRHAMLNDLQNLFANAGIDTTRISMDQMNKSVTIQGLGEVGKINLGVSTQNGIQQIAELYAKQKIQRDKKRQN